MLPNHYQYKKALSVYRYVNFWYLIILPLFFSFSCKKNAPAKDEDYSEGFKIIFDNVNKFSDNKKPAEGIHYLDSAFSHLSNPTLNDRFRYYGLHFMYNKKTSHNGRLELLFADSMVSVALKGINGKSYLSNIAEASFAKGDAYFDLRQYTGAYRCYYQGYFFGKNYLDNSVLAEYTYRMGMVMFRQSRFIQAANYFKISYRQSFAYHDDFRAFYQRQELLNDIGESYQHNGDIDSADWYFNKALAYINQNNERFKTKANMLEVARAVVYGDQGLIASSKGEYKDAADLFEKSAAINLLKFNDNADAEAVEINLGQLYLDTHQDELFMGLMNNISRQLDSVRNLEVQAGLNRLMSDYYNRTGDLSKAFKYFKIYTALKDSLDAQSNSLKETDVNQQLANYDKQHQIRSLEGDNKLQLIYLTLAVICVVMASVIISLIYRNWNRSKNDVETVSALNKQIIFQKTDLEITLENLKISNQEKDRILHSVAHDLRNPIGGIVSLTKAMIEDDYTDEQKALINLVNGASHNSLELINEILEATNNSTENLNKELVEINSLVSDSVEILSFKASEKGQQIITQFIAGPKKLLASREKIWRVISNLISNAIKFSPEGGTIYLTVTGHENFIQIAVTDNGIGIPDDLKPLVFNRFTNAKRSGTAGEKSFGLGLSICRQIIENHDGEIWFESIADKGTTFYITLPA